MVGGFESASAAGAPSSMAVMGSSRDVAAVEAPSGAPPAPLLKVEL